MRRLRSACLAVAAVLVAGNGSAGGGQQPGRAPASREQVHPELVDTTWGPRTAEAWRLAYAHEWDAARARFAALHAEQPAALEALVGLGFVARASGDAEDARRWFRAALAAEPSPDVTKQLEAAEWDRPGTLELSGGSTHVGNATTGDWSLAIVAPVVPRVSLTARVGVLGAGDPLRGVFVDSTSGVHARVLSGGTVVRPTDFLTLTGRVEYWTSGGVDQTFVWLDATQRFSDRLAVRIGARPVGGDTGAPQFTGGADVLVVPNQTATVEIVQAARAAPFEARTQLRAFYLAAPSVRLMIRAGVLRDAGPTNEATTVFAAGTWLARPTLGLRAEASTRRGAFARSSIAGGLVIRW